MFTSLSTQLKMDLNDTCLQLHSNQFLGGVLLRHLFSFLIHPSPPSLFLSLLSFKGDRKLKLARSCLGADGSTRVGEEGMEQISGRDGKIMTVALWVISRYSTYGGLGI